MIRHPVVAGFRQWLAFRLFAGGFWPEVFHVTIVDVPDLRFAEAAFVMLNTDEQVFYFRCCVNGFFKFERAGSVVISLFEEGAFGSASGLQDEGFREQGFPGDLDHFYHRCFFGCLKRRLLSG